MNRKIRSLLLFASIWLAAGVAARPGMASAPLPMQSLSDPLLRQNAMPEDALRENEMPRISPDILSMIQKGPASDALWAVVVADEDGTVLEEYNSRSLIRPASTQKLLTTLAALDLLGPEYRYDTYLYGRGVQQREIWKGDLIIRGTGDPSLNDDFYDDPLFLFEKWAARLDSMGIRIIDGNLLGNDAFFDDMPYPKGWEWDDLTFYYGVEIGALSFNKNVVDLEVMADGEPGTIPRIRWYPFNTPYVEFVNEQLITPAGFPYEESYLRIPGTNRILLRSRLPQGYYETEPLSVPSPTLYFLDTFYRVLEQRGITVTGQIVADREPRDWSDPEYRLLDHHRSVPLHLILDELVRESDNFYAEVVVKTLAAERFFVEGTTELGVEAVREYLHTIGLDTSKVKMRDGAGLASANLLTAGALNHLLHEARSMGHYDHFYGSLAVAGQTGTLRYRFGSSPVRGRFAGKTGFVTGVRTLAGYLRTRSGRQLTLTIATNHHTLKTPVIDRLHQNILEYLYSVY